MRGWALLGLVAVVSTGCVRVSDYDPVGNAASISGAWTIDGAAPTAESCRALGADIVRVTFLDDSRPVVHGALIYPCNTTCMESCFDTRPGLVVAGGEWTLRMEATRGAEVVAVGTAQVQSTEAGHIELEPAVFLSGRISARHQVDGSPPTYDSCRGAGVELVELTFDSAGGERAGAAREDCSVGAVGTRVAPGASYVVRLRALGPSGEIVHESAPETVEVAVGEHVELNGGAPFELTAL
jgi:hypothetical protein